ncbi:MAG: ATP synthase F1 subunit gamma [Chitinophagales bacterium]|nr:ATP synthase F1 subunit gamma [Chitinophagales bacterium]
MPANLKEVRGRIASVNSTIQITKAMKMVSAAKFKRATDRIIQIRPYSTQLSSVLSNIAGSLQGDVSISYAQQRPVKRILIVLITSDKGLCGGFNANNIKAVKTLLANDYKEFVEKKSVDLLCIGKKGNDAFKSTKMYINTEFLGLFAKLNFEETAKAAQYIMDAFNSGDYDQVDVVYGQFRNAAVQIATKEQFLPIQFEVSTSKTNADYAFEPGKEQLLEELVPKILKTQFFRYLLDSNASEHGARMTAMDKASENANELLRELKLSYNRARQAAITTELTEIVSGAAALSAG